MNYKIEGLVRELLNGCVVKYNGIDEESKLRVIDVSTRAITDEISKYATPQNISFLQSMLGDEASGSQFGATDMLQKMQDRLVRVLEQSAELDEGMAERLASDMVPAAFTMLSEKAQCGELEDFFSEVNG